MSSRKFSSIILDIEGTTTSISFVKEVLFPYITTNVKEFIKLHWHELINRLDIEALQKQSEVDVNDNVQGAVFIPKLAESPTPEEIEAVQNAVYQNVVWQMSLDRKTTALKKFQGYMWTAAYLCEEIHGHLFEDVPIAFKSWKDTGIKIYIYSSGSVEAQRLLFRHSTHGSLLKVIDGYFDTNIGQKSDPTSYKNILREIEIDGSSVVFLTDVPKEAYAAEEAGLHAVLVIREGNAPLSEFDMKHFTCISTFKDLKLC